MIIIVCTHLGILVYNGHPRAVNDMHVIMTCTSQWDVITFASNACSVDFEAV